ncbi:hypothetical protein MKZ38_001057 [Zalerion maritima]|uniref:Yippee domain-containing protein n=1 Tax=Zalerion maritima TaxID=339359 RepID=A0AAD5RQU5_9PEZI|nr:hypothetical protein MKZ38_001057 [Zalerion maritima]
MAPLRRYENDDSDGPTRPRPFLILPSLTWPFRRRSSTDSNDGGDSTTSEGTTPGTSPTAPIVPSASKAIPGSNSGRGTIHRARPDLLRCKHCSTEFAYASQILSKGFTGRLGRAYLVAPPQSSHVRSKGNNLFNIKVGKVEGRALVTGWHEVADITCRVCGETIGWKYVDAKDEAQKYKVGKFILETTQTVRYTSWENRDVYVPAKENQIKTEAGDGAYAPPGAEDWTQKLGDTGTSVAAVEFDSEDEDECDEIFAGVWDPTVAAKRRARKQRKVS